MSITGNGDSEVLEALDRIALLVKRLTHAKTANEEYALAETIINELTDVAGQFGSLRKAEEPLAVTEGEELMNEVYLAVFYDTYKNTAEVIGLSRDLDSLKALCKAHEMEEVLPLRWILNDNDQEWEAEVDTPYVEGAYVIHRYLLLSKGAVSAHQYTPFPNVPSLECI